MGISSPILKMVLHRRAIKGKENTQRIKERMGTPSHERPDGSLIWVHAASVGEAQSTLILIDEILSQFNSINILVTTGTVTSAELMEKRLPKGAFHQFYPLDNPKWAAQFLDHWNPDIVLWMESELWPNMLKQIRSRNIPAALINARLSKKSYKRWKMSGNAARELLATFSTILAQTDQDAEYYSDLCDEALLEDVIVSDNLKYSAAPLPFDQQKLDQLKAAISKRPLWLYASTHEGEEELACNIHLNLKNKYPELLTIIAPRHPERRDRIAGTCKKHGLNFLLRGKDCEPPTADTDIYIADTLGELGLFYRLSPIACIGRSFSNDGGGGHNPIEAAQLDCAIIHGPNVQNLAAIYKEMDEHGATIMTKTENGLEELLDKLLGDDETLNVMQNRATEYALKKSRVLEKVMRHLNPLIENSNIDTESRKCA
jgi:3-deoxy-D-manno-octulosonic-acid transferase